MTNRLAHGLVTANKYSAWPAPGARRWVSPGPGHDGQPGNAKRRLELGGAAVHCKASGAFRTMRQLGGGFGVAILVAVSGRVAVG